MQEVNKKLFAEVQEVSRTKHHELQAAIMSKIKKELEATSGKLQEILESVSLRITGGLKKTVDGKLVMMEEKITTSKAKDKN